MVKENNRDEQVCFTFELVFAQGYFVTKLKVTNHGHLKASVVSNLKLTMRVTLR